MIYPIVAYGDPVLRKKTRLIEKDESGLQQLIDDMFETMYAAGGVGLAAPQIGKAIRLFIVDASGFVDDDEEDEEGLKDFKHVFINPEISSEEGEEWSFNEGCLSIPEVREDVSRKETIHIKWLDENWQEQSASFSGLKARVIQHEYDHIEGVLFTDYLSPLRKRILKGRLANISKGKVSVSYRMKFPQKK